MAWQAADNDDNEEQEEEEEEEADRARDMSWHLFLTCSPQFKAKAETSDCMTPISHETYQSRIPHPTPLKP